MFDEICRVNYTLINILEDGLELVLKDKSEDVIQLAKSLNYKIIYTGSNLLKALGVIDRNIKDHDVVIDVPSDNHIKIINLIFEKWTARYPLNTIQYFSSFGGSSSQHFVLKASCDMVIDIFITVKTTDTYLKIYGTLDEITYFPINIMHVKPMMLCKASLDINKARMDAMQIILDFFKNDTKSENDKPVLPF